MTSGRGQKSEWVVASECQPSLRRRQVVWRFDDLPRNRQDARLAPASFERFKRSRTCWSRQHHSTVQSAGPVSHQTEAQVHVQLAPILVNRPGSQHPVPFPTVCKRKCGRASPHLLTAQDTTACHPSFPLREFDGRRVFPGSIGRGALSNRARQIHLAMTRARHDEGAPVAPVIRSLFSSISPPPGACRCD